jgi:hypothetical protein
MARTTLSVGKHLGRELPPGSTPSEYGFTPLAWLGGTSPRHRPSSERLFPAFSVLPIAALLLGNDVPEREPETIPAA